MDPPAPIPDSPAGFESLTHLHGFTNRSAIAFFEVWAQYKSAQ
jgi:hypothetical protein